MMRWGVFSVMPGGVTATKVMYVSLLVVGAWLTDLFFCEIVNQCL